MTAAGARFHSSRRGSSMVEMVILMPIVVVCILMVWEEYKFHWSRLAAIQATHIGVWQPVNGSLNANVAPFSNIVTFHDPDNITLTTFSLSQESPNVGGPIGNILSFFNLFNLNQSGKMRMRVAGNISLWEGSVIKGMLNLAGSNTGDLYSWNFTETLMVDAWGSTSEGDIKNHIHGGWLGPLGAVGQLAGMVTDVLNFLGIDVPRVNSSAVPPR